MVVLILDNDVRNISMLNNVTFNYVKFSVVIIIVLTVFPLLTDICLLNLSICDDSNHVSLSIIEYV